MPFGAVCIWMRARGTKWTQTDQVPVHNETIKLPGIQKDWKWTCHQTFLFLPPFVISTWTFNHLYFHTNIIQFYKLMIIQRTVLRIQVAAQDAYLSHTWDKPWVSNVTRLAPWSFLLRVLCALSFVEFSFHHNLRIFGDNLDLNHVSVRHHS